MDYLTTFLNWTMFLFSLLALAISLITLLAVVSMMTLFVFMICRVCTESRADHLGKKALARAKFKQEDEMITFS